MLDFIDIEYGKTVKNAFWCRTRVVCDRARFIDTPLQSSLLCSGQFVRGTSRHAAVAPRSVTTGVTVGAQQFRIGQGVRHGRFGEGTIIGLSGSGLEAQAQIQFREVGSKTLALGVAKLEITQS